MRSGMHDVHEMTRRLVLSLLLVVPPLSGQTRQHGPPSLELSPSTSAMAMGGAFQLTDPGSDAIFHNPALLGNAARFGIAGTTFDSESTSLTMSASTGWWGGGVGVGLQTLSYSTDASVARDILDNEADLLTSGARAVSEWGATVGYGRTLGPLDVGISAKAVEMRLAGALDRTAALDIGASIQVGRYRSDASLPSAFTIGLAVQNLGPELDLEGSQVGLARRVTGGASFQRWLVGPFDLAASAALSREADGDWIPAVGGEVAWWPVTGRTFIGRIGIRRSEDGPAKKVTFGGAFRGDALGVEYAFQGFDASGGAHRFGISWR